MTSSTLYKDIKLELINSMCNFGIPKAIVISSSYYAMLSEEQRYSIEALLLNHNSIKWLISSDLSDEYSILYSQEPK